MKRKILFAVCLLFGLMMINAGLDKFLHYMPKPDNLPEKLAKAFNAFTEIGWLLPLVGIVEKQGIGCHCDFTGNGWDYADQHGNRYFRITGGFDFFCS